MRLILFIAVNNGLGIIYVQIVNELCMSPCAKNIWSCCGVEFGPKYGAVLVLKRDLYGLKMAPNSLHKYFGDFLRYLRFTPSIADQELWIRKYDKYEGYDYIETHVDNVINAAKNPSKCMHEIDMYYKVRYITDSPNY